MQQSNNLAQTPLPQAAFVMPTSSQNIAPQKSILVSHITTDVAEIHQALQLRYRVFAEDMGATVESADQGIDKDHFDDACHHVIVKDLVSNSIVGYSRIVTSDMLELTGGYYSATEFDLSAILKPNKRYMEVGRTCVDSEFRSGAVIGLLWSTLVTFMKDENIDYLMGCASISVAGGSAKALAAINYLRKMHFTPEDLRAIPKIAMPALTTQLDGKSHLPPLLKTYLRIGAKVCGEAFLDRSFNVADVLILLARTDINQRYLRHFSK